ncbi:hypothetical protein MRX96_024332 [Rhipicephalus microplus]
MPLVRVCAEWLADAVRSSSLTFLSCKGHAMPPLAVPAAVADAWLLREKTAVGFGNESGRVMVRQAFWITN